MLKLIAVSLFLGGNMSRLTGEIISPQRRGCLLGCLANKEGNFDEIVNGRGYA